MKIIEQMYTPSEAAECTGRSTANQSNDRRKGYTPSTPGHARYDLQGVARLFVIQMFADRGVGPSVSSGFADEVAGEIAYHSQLMPGVWSENLLEKEKTSVERSGSAHLKTVLNNRPDLVLPAGLTNRLTAGREDAAGWATLGVVVWADGSHTISREVWQEIERCHIDDPRIQGAVTTLMIRPTAKLLTSRLPRPFYFSEDE